MRLKVATLAALSTLLAWPALAQDARSCMPFDKMKAKLAAEYQELMASSAMSDDGTLLAVFTSKDRTFTVVKVKAGGPACVVDFGKEWQPVAPAPEGQGS